MFNGSIAGQRLDGMKRRGHGFFAGLWPPEIVIHLDEEVIRRGIRQQSVVSACRLVFLRMRLLRMVAIGVHK